MGNPLLQDLQAPVKSFQLFALEQIIRDGGDQEILEYLRLRLPDETDDECRLLIAHAVRSLDVRLTGKKSAPVDGPVDDFLPRLQAATLEEKLTLLGGLPAKKVRELAPRASELAGLDANPVYVAGIIRLFARDWPEERLEEIAAHLFAPSLSLRLVALEALTQRAPENLVKELPALLVTEDPRLRALAIRGLAAIDADEALLHLEALLCETDEFSKKAAIQNCFLLPYERVKPLLLKFLAAEQSPALLEQAGYFFVANPDAEVPGRLLEIAEHADEERAGVVESIVDECLKIIEKAGLVRGDFAEYRRRLQGIRQSAAGRRFVQEVLQRLEAESEQLRIGEVEDLVRKNLANPGFRQAFEQAVNWNISELLKQRLKGLLRAAETEPAVSSGPVPAADEPRALPIATSMTEELKERIRSISSLDIDRRNEAQETVAKILRDESSPGDLIAAALRTAIRLRLDGFAASCERFLASSDPNLLAAIIEYIGVFASGSFFEQVGKHLHSGNPRVKAAAVRQLKKINTSQALSMLKGMLMSGKKPMQSQAISSFIFFDFALVRDILIGFFETVNQPPLIESGLCLFQANPERGNLLPLYRLEKSRPAPLDRLFRVVRQETLRALISLGQLTAEQAESQEAALEKQWLREQEKKQQPAPAYALKNLPAVRAVPVRTGSSPSKSPSPANPASAANPANPSAPLISPQLQAQIQDFLQENSRFFGGAAIVFLVCAGYFLLWTPGKPGAVPSSRSGAMPTSGAAHKSGDGTLSLVIEGTVMEVMSGEKKAIVQTIAGKKYMVISKTRTFQNIPVGERITAEVVPFGPPQQEIVPANLLLIK
jgi:DNA-binding MarR family transcriptional regulator